MSLQRPASITRALVLAFLMTFTVLASIPLTSEAHHGDPPAPTPMPAGTITVRPEPLWLTTAPTASTGGPLVIFAKPNADPIKDRSGAIHSIRLFNGAQQDYTKVEFIVSPTNTCTEDPAPTIEWVKEFSSSPGWTVSEDNRATCTGGVPNHRILTFTADPTAPIGGKVRWSSTTNLNLIQEFKIAMRALNSPIPVPSASATQVKLQIIAYPGSVSGSPPGQAAYDTACTAPVSNADCRSAVIMFDELAPQLRKAITRDYDHDGHLDHIELTFSENLDPTTFDYRAFGLTLKGKPSYKVTAGYFEPMLTTGGVLANDLDTEGDDDDTNIVGIQRLTDRITLVVDEQPFYDTGAMENLKITYVKGGGLEDLAGNDLAAISGSSVTMIDGAKPLVVGAWAIPGDETVHVFFSENIQGTGAPDTDCEATTWNGGAPNPANPRAVQLTDIAHTDTPPGGTEADGNIITNGMSQFDFIEHFQCEAFPDRLAITTKVNSEGAGRRYQFGARDSDPILGDLIGSALGSDTCTSVGVSRHDSVICNAKIRDWHGLTLWYDVSKPGTPGFRTMTYPLVKQADMDVSHDALRIEFNGYVRAHDPTVLADKPDPAAVVGFSNIDIESAATADPNAGEGPQGIDGAYYLPSSKEVDGATIVLRTDHPARTEDVDATPARVILDCDKIRASPAPGFGSDGVSIDTKKYTVARNYPVFNGPLGRVPCDNPDRFSPADADVEPNINLVDVTKPRIVQVLTHDADHNGLVDGVELTFSEPVNDGSFNEPSVEDYLGSQCFNTVTGTGQQYCPGLDPEVKFRLVDYPDRDALECFAPYRWDTGLLTNDNVGVLGAVTVTKNPTSGARFERVRDCEQVFLGKDTNVTLATDYVMGLAIRSPLFRDTAVPPNDMPVYCEQPTSLCPDHLKVLDGAPPVVMKAETVDTPVFDEKGDIAAKLINAKHGDGFIDGYRLTFSEPILDGSYKPANFKVGGGSEHEYLIPSTNAGRSWDVNEDTTKFAKDGFVQLANDEVFTILFGRGTLPDTDARPQLTYTVGAGPTFTGIRDHVGNVMVDFGTTAVDEQDGAAPQIVGVAGTAGNPYIDITFSEPVDDGGRNVVVQSDFQYSNRDSRANPDGVAGKSGTLAVCHGDGSPQYPSPSGCDARPLTAARLPLDRPLTASDIKNDRFQAIANKVFEVAPSVAQKKSVPDYFHKLNEALDLIPPGPITDLSVVAELTTANSAVLKFTAPADDGLAGGFVGGYLVQVREINATSKPFENATGIYDPLPEGVIAETFVNVDGEEVIGDVIAPGYAQTIRISGLKPTTTYDVEVIAFDDGGNLGEYIPAGTSSTGQGSSLGAGALVRTRSDGTPPAGTLTVTSKTHKAGATSLLRNATFEWTQARDDESTVVYRYTLNQNPDYLVLATDLSTTNRTATRTNITDGNWFFHVAAFSGGGAGKTAHYNFRIGQQEIQASAIESANDLVQETIVREVVADHLVNRINWTLPATSDLPAGAVLDAVEIWREDDGLFTLVKTIPGTYDQLKNGTYTDTDPKASADSAYRVDMLFSGGQRQADPLTGYTALTDNSPQPIPLWLIVLIAVAGALIIAGIVIFAMLRRRQKGAATGGIPYAWESANPDTLGIDEATGLPVHNVKCPSCAAPFQAVGNLPLPITCPNCNATGTLD